MNRVLSFIFDAEDESRLDKYLVGKVPSLSRAKIQNFISAGMARVNDQLVQKPAHSLETGDKIEFVISESADEEVAEERGGLDVLYFDESIVVINKAAGQVVHPGAGHSGGTLVNTALGLWPEMREVGEPTRPGVVHRLDKDTSGVLLLARNQVAYEWLVKQFKSRKTQKTYLALVDGAPPTPTGKIEAAVARDAQHRQRMAVAYAGSGRKATTEYHTIKGFGHHTLLEVRPLTGRTHQIRVHMAFLGCPVTGDRVYGRRKPSLPISRFFLHASRIKIMLPGETQFTEFSAPLPGDLEQVIKNLEKG